METKFNNIRAIEGITAQLTRLDARVTDDVDNVKNQNVAQAAVYYYRLKEACKSLEDALKCLNKSADYMNKALLPQMLEAQGVDKIQVPELARSFYVLTKSSCSILDRDRGMAWLRDRGDGSLITETVNAGTLAAYMSQLITKEGIDPPEDIFKYSTYNTTGTSRYTPKAT